MLEKMDEFFNNRLEGYEEHQLNVIERRRVLSLRYAADRRTRNRGVKGSRLYQYSDIKAMGRHLHA